MTPLTRTLLAHLEVRDDGDHRSLAGLVMPYDVQVDIGPYRESFAAGAFADANPAEVVLTATHPKDGAELPIGITTQLREEPDGLHGVWRVSRTQLGDEVLALARDGVPLGLSVGFLPDPAADRWSRDRTVVERRHATLDHIAVVRSPAYPSARVTDVRGNGHRRRAPLLWLVALRRR
jgi:HK97 family phage prohead protease